MRKNLNQSIKSDVAIVVFAKPPVPGQVKTRLGRDVGERVATQLYRCFLEDITRTVMTWAKTSTATIEPILAYTASPKHPGYALFRKFNFKLWAQGDGDLGARMARVSQRCFDAGAKRVLIIGADSPTLTPAHLQRALKALDTHDIALGPSRDGGYYLVALGRPTPEIFRGIEWSTARVFAQTVAACQASSLLCATLECWYDVDTFEDLIFLKNHLLDVLERHEPTSALQTAHHLKRLDAEGVFHKD